MPAPKHIISTVSRAFALSTPYYQPPFHPFPWYTAICECRLLPFTTTTTTTSRPLVRPLFIFSLFYSLSFYMSLTNWGWFRICHTDKHVESELSRRIRVKRVSLTVLGHSSLSLTMPITSQKRGGYSSRNTNSGGPVWSGHIFDDGNRDLNADNYARIYRAG